MHTGSGADEDATATWPDKDATATRPDENMHTDQGSQPHSYAYAQTHHTHSYVYA